MGFIADRFGTVRGLVRLALTHAELMAGRGGVQLGDPALVRRLVFVCHGNICRSAFADVAAREAGLATASFGLSAESGRAAHGPAIEAGARIGHDLNEHRATDVSDYVPQEGDLLLVMETRQLRRIAANPRLAHLPRTLLGLYTTPRTPHLHDPYSLSTAYMDRCLSLIDTAISALSTAFPNSKA